MNKLSLAFAKTFAVALGLMIGALVVGCKSTTEPDSTTPVYDSEAAADLTATALGNQSGGLGMALGDSYELAMNGALPHSSIQSKGDAITSLKDSSYDPSTGWHTVTITKNITWNKVNITSDFIYQYQLIDTAHQFQAKWKKGLIDTIHVKFSGTRHRAVGERLIVDDAASGEWWMSGLANFTASPMFSGTYSRSGNDTLLTKDNSERTLNHTMTISFSNDTLIRLVQGSDKYFFLAGTATSVFHAETGKGIIIDRNTVITFNGDGTATLDVTRSKGGITDTFTVDVVVGIFKRFGK
jgi:hypothetical protein